MSRMASFFGLVLVCRPTLLACKISVVEKKMRCHRPKKANCGSEQPQSVKTLSIFLNSYPRDEIVTSAGRQQAFRGQLESISSHSRNAVKLRVFPS